MFRPAPEPPYPAELLADLHADNLDPDLARQLWPRVRSDPQAQRVLAALDQVSGQLRGLNREAAPPPPIPVEIAERLERAIAAQSAGIAAPTSLDAARRRRSPLKSSSGSPLRWTLAAAAAVAALAGGAIALQVTKPTTTSPPAALPADVPELGNDPSGGLPVGKLLSAQQKHSVAGLLGDSAALSACLRAVGAAPPPLGSLDVRYRGRDAVLVLTRSKTPGKVTALVVNPTCAPGNAQLLARQEF